MRCTHCLPPQAFPLKTRCFRSKISEERKEINKTNQSSHVASSLLHMSLLRIDVKFEHLCSKWDHGSSKLKSKWEEWSMVIDSYAASAASAAFHSEEANGPLEPTVGAMRLNIGVAQALAIEHHPAPISQECMSMFFCLCIPCQRHKASRRFGVQVPLVTSWILPHSWRGQDTGLRGGWVVDNCAMSTMRRHMWLRPVTECYFLGPAYTGKCCRELPVQKQHKDASDNSLWQSCGTWTMTSDQKVLSAQELFTRIMLRCCACLSSLLTWWVSSCSCSDRKVSLEWHLISENAHSCVVRANWSDETAIYLDRIGFLFFNTTPAVDMMRIQRGGVG